LRDMQRSPPEQPPAPRDVGIFAIREEVLVKILMINCNIIYERSAIDRGGSGDTKDFMGAGCRVPGHVEMPSTARHADSDRVDLLGQLDVVTASTEQSAGRRAKLAPLPIQRRNDAGDVARGEKRVGIAERDEVALRFADCLIGRGGE